MDTNNKVLHVYQVCEEHFTQFEGSHTIVILTTANIATAVIKYAEISEKECVNSGSDGAHVVLTKLVLESSEQIVIESSVLILTDNYPEQEDIDMSEAQELEEAEMLHTSEKTENIERWIHSGYLVATGKTPEEKHRWEAALSDEDKATLKEYRDTIQS